LHTSLNIIRGIKSRRIRRARHVPHVGGREMHTKFWLENLKGRDYSEDIGIDRRILDRCLGNRVGSCGMDSSR
jgi:hypothetical protein